jgi:hypothetical protein
MTEHTAVPITCHHVRVSSRGALLYRCFTTINASHLSINKHLLDHHRRRLIATTSRHWRLALLQRVLIYYGPWLPLLTLPLSYLP